MMQHKPQSRYGSKNGSRVVEGTVFARQRQGEEQNLAPFARAFAERLPVNPRADQTHTDPTAPSYMSPSAWLLFVLVPLDVLFAAVLHQVTVPTSGTFVLPDWNRWQPDAPFLSYPPGHRQIRYDVAQGSRKISRQIEQEFSDI